MGDRESQRVGRWPWGVTGSEQATGTHIQLLEHRVGLNAREEHAHGVGPVVQEGDLHHVHVVCQLVDVCLQLGKGWEGRGGEVSRARGGGLPACPPCAAPPTPGTFLAFQSHAGLQVVHLELEPLERAVRILSLALVGNQHSSDGQQQEPAAHRQPHHGRQSQCPLGRDVQGAQPELQAAHQHLQEQAPVS